MKVQDVFALVTTDHMVAWRDFYVRHFGFEVGFESPIYLQMAIKAHAGPGFSLAFMPTGHPFGVVGPEPFNGHGLMLTIQVADAAAIYAKVNAEHGHVICELKTEPWGQRRFTMRDPAGVAVDVVQIDGIEAQAGYYEQFTAQPAAALKQDILSSAAKQATWETYNRSWSASDPAERLALFARCLHQDCVYTDPATQVSGYEQLAAYMAGSHARFPGLHFVLTDFMAHHDRSVSHWNMMGLDGKVLLPGVSYGLYAADGKLLQMSGFFAS